jgi:hypothetical protein
LPPRHQVHHGHHEDDQAWSREPMKDLHTFLSV